jgi:hypothetical protein
VRELQTTRQHGCRLVRDSFSPATGKYRSKLWLIAQVIPSFRLVDLNGDGLLDILYSRAKSSTEIEHGAYFNNGSTWIPADPAATAALPALADEHGQDQGVRLIDVDGNGLLDVIQSFGRGESDKTIERRLLLNAGQRADMLTEIDQGFDLKTTIAYQTLLETKLVACRGEFVSMGGFSFARRSTSI